MFWPDVLEYRRFYSSKLGQLTGRQLRHLLRAQWGTRKGDTVLVLGYGLPFCRVFKDHFTCVTNAMPAMQGSIQWPGMEQNRTLLTDEYDLPFADSSVDAIILCHILEHTHNPEKLMQEVWRVLIPNGRLMALAPNRRGVWARMDTTPLGHGRPFSLPQLRRLVEETRFNCLDSGSLLFFPPSPRRLALRLAPTLERSGALCLPWFGGMLWLEAEKQLLAVLPRGNSYAENLKPVFAPTPKPALGRCQ